MKKNIVQGATIKPHCSKEQQQLRNSFQSDHILHIQVTVLFMCVIECSKSDFVVYDEGVEYC